MSRIQTLWAYGLLVTFTAVSVGCNCCGPANSSCGNGFAASPTIAPPPTYSLQIPSANGAAPYYVPGAPNAASTATLPPHLVDPSSRAPSPNAQNGWRPADGNNLGTNAAPVNRVQATSTTFAQNNLAPAASVAQNPQSVLSSINYASTRTDETMDRTRIPATDASNVRAPASFVNNGTATQLARVQQAPNYPTTYNQTAGFNRPAPQVYNGTQNIIAGPNPTGSIYYGTPFATQAPAVLAQATTGSPASNFNNTSGWRDREITASRGALNR